MSLINISNLTFAYSGGENIFSNVSFRIDTDWKLGFIGRNGRGKTTFLKLLQGEYEYGGNISSSVTFDYFPMTVKNHDLNPRAIAEKICPNLEHWRLEKEISLLGLQGKTLDTPFRFLSGGEKTKIILACLFLKNDNFLLIDEPTNHLDIDARNNLRYYLRAKEGFILVSHDRTLLDDCTDHTLSINKTDIEIQKGNFSSWLQNKEKRDEWETSENEKLKKNVKKLHEAALNVSNWSYCTEKTKNGQKNSGSKVDKGYIGHKAAKLMKRSKSIEKRKETAVEEKAKLLKNIETNENLSMKPLRFRSGILLSIRNVSLFYDDFKICKNLSFNLTSGSRIAFVGKNGCGKSSLFKLLTGIKIKYSGDIYMESGLKISYIPQDTSFLKGTLRDFAYDNRIDESLFKALMRKMGIERADLEKDMNNFSDGWKKKTLIAKSLCQEAHLYIWDEPLNFIDVISRGQIEDAILESEATMIFAEHDETFVNKIANEIVYL